MEFQMTKQNADYRVQVISSPPSSKMDGEGEGVGVGVDDGGQSPCSSRGWKKDLLLIITQLTLRILVVAFTLVAIIITVTANQTENVGMLTFKAQYNYSSAMRFQVGANAVVCTFSFLSSVLILLPGFTRPKSDPRSYFYWLLHDMVMTMLVISGCAAGSTVGYLAKYGQEQGSWIAFCKYLDKFCNKLQVALAFAYLAFFCMFVLTITAAWKLKSQATHCR